MAKSTGIKRLLAGLCCIASFSLFGASESKTEIEFHEDDGVTNEIPYFDNRFRIDAELDEIELIFYRVSGTPPIILVRPDGSKLKINNYPKERIQWFDDRSFDMIKIKKPMPGPWQVIGSVLPNSKIMVVSEVRMEVSPLPEILLAGETLKMTAKLFNADKAIDEVAFREVVNLDVDFYSTNNPDHENFGADSIQLTTFRDDGRELDEYARDNKFTGEFILKLAAGEWEPEYSIKLPMAERKLTQPRIILQPSPVELTVEASEDELVDHKVTFNIHSEFVKPESLVFQGKITLPNKEVEPFTISEEEVLKDPKIRQLEIGYSEPGIHKLTTFAYGETINGREFRLELHEFTFNVKAPPEPDPITGEAPPPAEGEEADELSDIEKQLAEQEAVKQAALMALEEEKARKAEEAEQFQFMLIVAINVILVIIGGIALWLALRKKKK